MAAPHKSVGPQLEIVDQGRASADDPIINSSTRIPALDGLRGVAILLVLLFHSVPSVQTDSRLLAFLLAGVKLAWSGVDLFFVLSGFLIGGILLDARSSPRYFKTFYLRRAYRILPLYAVVLALFSLRFLPVVGSLGNLSENQIPWLAYASFTQNIWMAVLGTFGTTAMVVTWSLAVEEQFYLTVPFLIKKVSNAKLAYVLVGIVVAAPILRTTLHLLFRNGNFAAYVLMPTRADALSLGILSALLVRTPRSWRFLRVHRSVLCLVTGLLFVGLIPLSYRGYELSTVMVTGGYSWLALFYTGCLLIAVTGTGPVMERALCNPMLMQLGVLAYCTYLLHVPFIEGTRRLLGLRFGYASTGVQFFGGVIGIVLTLAVARLSWIFFEKPCLRRGHAYKY